MGGKPRDWVGQGLFRTCSRGNLTAAKSLLVQGANVNYKDSQGNTPLMSAGWEGHSELVELLLDHGATLDGKNRFGFTALILAVHYQRVDVVKQLLEAGANVNESHETKGLLFKNPLVVAAHHGNTELVKLLIEHGADFSISNSSGKSVNDYLRQSKEAEILSIVRSDI